MKTILITILACAFAYGQRTPELPPFKVLSYKSTAEHTHQFTITDGHLWELQASEDMKTWAVVWSPFTKVVNEDGTATYTYTRFDKGREFFRYKLIDPDQRGVFVDVTRDNVLSLIDGVDPTVDNNNKLFLQYDGPDNLVRNPNNFMHRLKGVTGLVAWNSKSAGGGRFYGGAAVTPFHVICSAHAPYQTGDTLYFVTRSNKVISRTVFAVQGTGFNSEEADYKMCLLNNPLPPTIEPIEMMPTDSINYINDDQTALWFFKYMTYVWVNQWEETCVGTFRQLNMARYDDPTPDVFSQYGHAKFVSTFGLQVPDAEIDAWKKKTIPGDSGSLTMFVVGNKLVAAGHYTSPASGTWYGQLRNMNDFNRMIELLDVAGGFDTGETITQADMRKFIDLSADESRRISEYR